MKRKESSWTRFAIQLPTGEFRRFGGGWAATMRPDVWTFVHLEDAEDTADMFEGAFVVEVNFSASWEEDDDDA